MNLIEQLGGYEKAKDTQKQRALNGLLHDYDWELHSALLEYRRQHNIFEVGDLVVNDAFINSNIYVFLKLMPDISMAMIAYDEDEGACGLYSLRHATPAEIQAGRRL